MMRLRIWLISAFALGGIWAGGTPVDAQTIPSPYRYIERAQAVSPFGGYILTDRGEFGLGPASAPVFGIRYTGRFAGPVAGIARVSAAPSERTVFARSGADPEAPLEEIARADALILLADAGLRLNITGPRSWNSIAPFAELMGGIVSLRSARGEEEGQLPENQIADLGPSFAVNVGAGADWFLTERISLGLAGHGLLWRLTTPAGLAGTQGDQSDWTKNVGITLGAAIHF